MSRCPSRGAYEKLTGRLYARPIVGDRAIGDPARPNLAGYEGGVDFTETPFPLQASLQPARHGGQWPLIWRRRTTSRGYKERRDSPDFHPVPRASCHPIPPLYLIPRPSRLTSPVSVSNNDRRYRVARETSAFADCAFNPPRSPFRNETTSLFLPSKQGATDSNELFEPCRDSLRKLGRETTGGGGGVTPTGLAVASLPRAIQAIVKFIRRRIRFRSMANLPFLVTGSSLASLNLRLYVPFLPFDLA